MTPEHKPKKPNNRPEICDEPGMEERFQRGLKRALSTPPKPHKTIKKRKERPASKGRVHRDSTHS